MTECLEAKDESRREYKALREDVKNILSAQAKTHQILLAHVKIVVYCKGPQVPFELDKAHCDCIGSAPVECGPAKDLG